MRQAPVLRHLLQILKVRGPWLCCLFCNQCRFWAVLGAPVAEKEGAAPLAGRAAETGPTDSITRRLAGLISAGTELPENLQVVVGNLASAAAGQSLEVLAGVNYSSLVITATGSTFATSLSGVARLRLVLQGTHPQYGGCDDADFYRPGGSIGFSGQAIPLVVDGSDIRSTGPLSFMLGGFYQLCYSYDGSFSGASSQLLQVPTSLDVRGARLACEEDGCLEKYRWKCFVYSDETSPASSCIVKFTAVVKMPNSQMGRLSWGPSIYYRPGSTEPIGWRCGGTPSDSIIAGYLPPMLGTLGREFSPRARAHGSDTRGFSVQACYCPQLDGDDTNLDTCDSDSEFVQPVGRIYFYYTKACDDATCTNEYLLVNPVSPFTMHVECAGSRACSETTVNRMKVIDHSSLGVNDRPFWAESTGCRVFAQSENYLRPYNCAPGELASCGGSGGSLNGGDKADVKIFEGLVLGPAYVSGVSMTRLYDVCYCDSGCDAASTADAASNFHKVGRIRITPLQMVAVDQTGQTTGVTTVGVVGDVMVNGRGNVPIVPRPAQMKLLWDNTRIKTSADCAALSDLVEFPANEGPACSSANQCSYKAALTGIDPGLMLTGRGTVVTFNDGGTRGQRITFPQVGIVAICYCGVLADGTGVQEAGECLKGQNDFSYWILMVRTLVRGPCLPGEKKLCKEQEWQFYTGIVFRLEVHGLGLRSTDKLRIIPANDHCRDNRDGGGEPTVMKNCPEGCSPLSLSNTYLYGGGEGKDDVDVQITTSTTVGCDVQNANCQSVRVVEIKTYFDHSVWRFERDPLLLDDDTVVLHNVTGGTAEENAMMAGQIGLEHIGWPVTRQTDPTKFRVAAHLDPGNIPRFTPGGAWHRHNMLYTREELKATVAKSELQVCWGSGPDAYHARAGVITFIDPARMPAARLSLSGLEEGKQSPAIVSFDTASGGAAGMRYKVTLNSMRLRLAFEEVTKLEPLFADADAQSMPRFPPTDVDELPEAKQSVCGQLFLELWSEDAKGFPMPLGCYYGPLMDNRRELHVVFEPKNGLEAGQHYQMVLNLRAAAGASSDDSLLSVWSMDDVVELPYSAVELGDARLSKNPKPASGIGEPRLMSSGGLTLLDEEGEFRSLLELTTDPVSLLFRVQGDGRSRIVAGTYLRIFLRPLTVWSIRELCQAECFPHRTLVCGSISFCRGEAVVEKGQRNVIRLQLPQTMTEIYGATVQHTVRVSELSLPERGFFGTRIGAQVSTEDDSRVHYSETSGAFIWKAPSARNPQTSVASIVTQGDGNDRPFIEDVGNTLYIRVIFGTSLRAELRDGDASFTVTLPLGYTCGAMSPVPSNLLAFGEKWPQGRGSLRTYGGGSWHLTGHICEYSLNANQLIPAGTHLYMKVTVDQPKFPLQKTDVLNRWSLQLSSKGWYRKAAQLVPPVNFVGSDQCSASCALSTNVAVLGKLSLGNLQPRSLKVGDADNVLQIFFRPHQRSGYQGMVMILAPIGFNFATAVPDKCQPSRLMDEYYRTVGVEQPTRYLPIVESCISDCSAVWSCPDATYNRAKIKLRNSLEPEFVYGFRIFVINKVDYEASDVSGWRIITTDIHGHHLDATYPTARLNPAIGGTSRAWGVVLSRGRELQVGLQFSTLLPSAVTGALASLTIFPIELNQAVVATCRLILPAGYETTPVDFVFHFSKVPGATASWPGQTPWQSQQRNPGRYNEHGDQARNVLLWDQAKYNALEKYGFTTKVSIPRQPSTTTSEWLILQFGWDAPSLPERPVAYVLPLPQIQAITNLMIRYRTNVFGLMNFLTISLETSMAIDPGGELRIDAPEGFIFEERCTPETAPGEDPLAVRLECQTAATLARDGTVLGTLITLTPALKALPSGRHSIGLKARNPSAPRTNRGGQDTDCGREQCWQAGSVDSLGNILDTSSTAPGFAVNRQMVEAKLLDLNGWQRLSTGRNDRPKSPNNLIFAFRLSEKPSSVGNLVLSGPWGFVFEEDCLPGLRIEDTKIGDRGVFGTLSWMLRYTPWEEAAKVRSCSGDGSVATMYVELGLRANELYAFRIHLASNPEIAPNPNSWMIEYAGESCIPFEGFTLWTFSEYELYFTIAAASTSTATVPNPVILKFRPHKQVNADPLGQGTGGLLRITAPVGFLMVTRGALGQSCSDYVLKEGQTIFEPGVDILCGVQEDSPNIVHFSLIGQKKIEAGKLYELTVQFYNPRTTTSKPMQWVASTFSDSSGAVDAALDSTTIEGYPINTPMLRWTVTPPPGEQHAGAIVEGVSFEMAFPVLLVPRSEILITAPAAFDLAAAQQCDPQIGNIIGGLREHIGFSDSLLECAKMVWDSKPQANAAAWNTEDSRCFSYIGTVSLDICAPVPAADANSSASARRQQSIKDCSRYVYHVCSFASQNRQCNQFAFQGETRLQLEPLCEKNKISMRMSDNEELPPTTSIKFVLTTRNPATNPPLIDSYWIAQQYSPETVLLSSWSTSSWTVIPVLVDCFASLTGILKASGSLSELTLTFVPTSNADEIEIIALSPFGWDFAAAIVVGTESFLKRRDGTSVLIRREVLGGKLPEPPVVLRDVRLPQPGNVAFRIVTYTEGFKADETLTVSGDSTFNVPGTIEVLDQRLETIHTLTSDLHPYRSGFMPRAGDAAIATFILRLSARTDPGEELIVSGLPFRFEEEGAVKKLSLLAESGKDAFIVGTVGTTVNDGAALRILMLAPLEAGESYALQLETRTGPLTFNSEKWSFDTRRGDATLPTNTNDGLTTGFELVHTILLTISVGRVAPRTNTDLELVIDPQGASPTTLKLYGPKGFAFPTGTCLKDGTAADAKILSCRRGDFSNIAVMQLQGSGLQVAARANIIVRAPDKQDITTGNTWLVEAQAGVQQLQVGWGEAPGFQVVEMDEARLIYGGAPSFRTHMAAIFRTSQTLFGGGRIDILAPEVYKLSCRESQGFSPISVKGIQSCDDAGIGRLSLTLNETLATGDYAFMFGATNPYITPAQNLFSIMLLDVGGNVIDARMLFQGQRIVQGLFVRPPSLEWSSSQPLAKAKVQISLVVSTALDPTKAIGATRALQIGVPERFSLITNRPVDNVDGLVTTDYGWFHMYYTERLVRIDLVKGDQEVPRIIPEGTYRFAFYVRLPEFWMPNVNVWLLSLCRDLRCTDLIATLPAAGFDFGDEPTIVDDEDVGTYQPGGTSHQWCGPGTYGHAFMVLVICFTWLINLPPALQPRR